MKMMSYKISVVIPCFNASKTITRALDSVFCQTLQPVEVICIDDCSTDNTLELLNNYSKNNLSINIKIIKNGYNSGPSKSRNAGIVRAAGDWIAFLDADDSWRPDKLAIQSACITKYDLALIGCRFSIEDVNWSLEGDGFYYISYNKLLFRNVLSTPSVMLKKEIGFLFDEEMKYAEDFDLWLRIAKSGVKLGSIDLPLVILGKPSYGSSGLSASLLKMQIGELRTLSRNIIKSPFYSCIAIVWSLMKFQRRCLIVFLRSL